MLAPTKRPFLLCVFVCVCVCGEVWKGPCYVRGITLRQQILMLSAKLQVIIGVLISFRLLFTGGTESYWVTLLITDQDSAFVSSLANILGL